MEHPQRNNTGKARIGVNVDIKRTEAKIGSNSNKLERKARIDVQTTANTSMVSSSSGVSDDLEEYEDDFEVTINQYVFNFFYFEIFNNPSIDKCLHAIRM